MTPEAYVVTTARGGVYTVCPRVYEDPGLVPGNEYTPENCLWFDDIVAGLADHVPGTEEFASVKVL